MTAARSTDRFAGAWRRLAARSPVTREFARYLACSLLALAVDTGLYHGTMQLGLHYPWAAIVGFLAGLATAYTLSVRWAFEVRNVSNRTAEFAIFAGVGIAGLALTEGLLWLQIEALGLHPLAAKIVAAGVVCVFNFGGRKALLFTRDARVRAKLGALA